MPSSIKLYTTRNMEKARCTLATSQATGHPKENLVDNNLDTYWKPTSTLDQSINIDLGELRWVSHVVVFIKNYTEIAAGDYDVWYSDNGSTWYILAANHTLIDTSTPIRISTDFYARHRYWRIVFDNMAQIIKVAGVWWCRYYNIAQGNEYPEADADRFYNRAAQLPGGRLGIAGINRNSSRLISRRYLFSGVAEFNKLRTAFLDSAGRRSPLVLNEGSDQSDARLVHFANDEFAENGTDYQVFQPSVSFIELPYIDDGDSY